MAHDSKTTFCTLDGCDKPHRARGLCNTHYGQRHQPNRHRKVTATCGWCGTNVIKDVGAVNKYASVYCSLEHRDNARRKTGKSCELPDDHWARWYGASSAWVPPKPKPARFISRRCDECESWFVVERTAGLSIYCSKRCAKRTAKRARRAREHNAPGSFTYGQLFTQYLRQGRACAYCKQPAHGAPDPEHVLPLSRGGRNDMSNLVAACRACNRCRYAHASSVVSTAGSPRWARLVAHSMRVRSPLSIMHDEPTRPPYRLAA